MKEEGEDEEVGESFEFFGVVKVLICFLSVFPFFFCAAAVFLLRFFCFLVAKEPKAHAQ